VCTGVSEEVKSATAGVAVTMSVPVREPSSKTGLSIEYVEGGGDFEFLMVARRRIKPLPKLFLSLVCKQELIFFSKMPTNYIFKKRHSNLVFPSKFNLIIYTPSGAFPPNSGKVPV